LDEGIGGEVCWFGGRGVGVELGKEGEVVG
jgi:hypothetical protein